MRRIDEEAEANYFAMCLLIPERMIRKRISESGYILDIDDGGALQALRKRLSAY